MEVVFQYWTWRIKKITLRSMKRFLILFLPFIINSQVIQTNDTIVLDEVSVKILREYNKEELSIYSISKIDLDLKQKYLRQYNLSEYLNYVPGVFIMNSNNYAQDERISIRGFGSRANFGVRGIKIYVDGLPETFVDGQSQLDNINLEIINQIEVLRGVNSSLYGNSSGGIISISTIDFFEKDFIKTNLSAGSFESLKINLTSGINLNKGKIIFHLNRSSSNGFRNNSKFLNHNFNFKYLRKFDKGDFKIIANILDSPYAKDPGGLTKGEVESNRKQARKRNVDFNSGEKVNQFKIGLLLNNQIGDFKLRNKLFFNNRLFYGKLPYARGGIIDLKKNFLGYNLNISKEKILKQNLGLEINIQNDERLRFFNINGNRGELVMNQDEKFNNFSTYYSNSLKAGKFTFNASLRFDNNTVKYDDFINNKNGSIKLNSTSLSSNINYNINDSNEIYVNYSNGFETPTLNEFSSNISNTGFNENLDSSKYNNYEIGFSNFNSLSNLNYRIIYFKSYSKNEIVSYQLEDFPDQNFYRNSGKTSRSGIESEINFKVNQKLKLNLISTIGNYKFVKYEVNGQDFSNNRIAGLPKNQHVFNLNYSLTKKINLILDFKMFGNMYADNANKTIINDYKKIDLTIFKDFNISSKNWNGFISINNLTNTKYFDNIRINAFGSRYYEPASGLNFMLGIRK